VRDNRWMLFALPDYDLACAHVISQVTKDIARASDPVLSQIKVVPMKSTVSSVVETRGDMALDLPAEPIGFELGVKAEDVRAGNFEALQVKLVDAAEGYAEQLSKLLYGSLDKITTATGNTTDAEGQPFSFEMLYETLDKIEWTLDENDELSTPSLVMHPDMASKLPQPTPEQVKMIEELKARKLEELLARRRSRRIS
jgi:hypothetical protein